jgi:prophage regulatory protein
MPGILLRLPEVLRRTGLSRSTLYVLMADNLFPRSVHLSARSVAWREEEVEHFIGQCPRTRSRESCANGRQMVRTDKCVFRPNVTF